MASSQGPLAGAVLAQLQKYPNLDSRAVLAIAAHEGLGGGIGDHGTSFGPFQLHAGGALPTGISNPQQWAWSPAGIDYALSRIAGAAGGLKGLPAIEAISRRFERPADPSSEIADAARHYGIPIEGGSSIQFGGGAAGTSSAGTGVAAAPDKRAFVQQLLSAISSTGQLDDNGLVAALQARRGGQLDAAWGGHEGSGAKVGGKAGQGQSGLPPLPGGKLAAAGGIQVDPLIASAVDGVIQRFGVSPTSGYRSAGHNAQVGGADNSDHLRGDAVDFSGTPQQLQALYQWAQGRFPYVEPMAQAKNHVHISFRRPGA